MTHQLFENRLAALNRQVIHMDQGVAYSPEFRVSRQMSDYPSRKMEVARAIALGYAEPTPRACAILNNHILSRQGERWQNFRENPEEYTELMITAREMVAQMGFNRELTDRVRSDFARDLTPGRDQWNDALPVDKESENWLFLNNPTWENLLEKRSALGALLRRRNLTVLPHERADRAGWELFAHGLRKEGDAHLRSMVEAMRERGVKRIITTCGQGNWVWRTLIPARGIDHSLEIVDLVDLLAERNVSLPWPAYFYVGSFNTRYLGRSDRFNALATQGNPRPISASEEFTPVFEVSAGRVNEVNIWQKPIVPEYSTFGGVPQETLEGIYQDGMSDYHRAPKSTLVVFEPCAWEEIRKRDPNTSMVYYWEIGTNV